MRGKVNPERMEDLMYTNNITNYSVISRDVFGGGRAFVQIANGITCLVSFLYDGLL